MSRGRISTTPRRAHRRRLVALVAVGALASIAATCQAAKPPAPPPPPPPPSVYCHPTTPTNAQQYQAAFDGLRATNTAGWVATDGGLPVKLTDGRVLWLFGDTIIGASQKLPASFLTMANNGFVVQDGRCFTPMTEPIPDPPGDHWIWPTGAVEQNNTLLVFGLHMRRGGSPPFDFQLVRIVVARFSLPGLTLQSPPTDLPLPAGTSDPGPTYGESVLVDEDHEFVYAYGQERGPGGTFGIARHYVARAPIGNVPSGPWEFWHGDDPLDPIDSEWMAGESNASPMLFDNLDVNNPGASDGEGPVAGFAVGVNGSYVGSAFPVDAFVTPSIQAWHSSKPEGPWTLQSGPAVNVHNGGNFPDHFAYGGRVVFGVPGSPIALWSTNAPIDAILANPSLYKVWFAQPALS